MKRDNYIIMTAMVGNGIGLSVQFFFAQIKAGLIISPILSTMMIGLYFITSSIFGVIIGKVSDRLKKRRIFGIGGNVMAGIVYIQYFYVSHAAHFLIYSLLVGIAVALVYSTMPALFSEKEPEMDKGRLMSFYNTGLSLGWAVGVFAGEFLILFIGDFLYILYGIIPLISAVLLIFVPDEPFSNINPKKIPESESGKSAFQIVQPLLICFAMMLAFRHLTSQGSVISLLPNYLGLVGASEIERGILFSLNSFLQVPFMFPIGKLVDKIGRRAILFIGVVGTMFTAVGYGFSTFPLQILPSQILMAFSWGCIITGGTAYVIDLTTQEDRAKGMGYLNAGLSVGGTAGPFLAGLFLFVSGLSFQWSFIWISLFSIPAIVLWGLQKEDRKTHSYKFIWQKNYIRAKS